MHALDWDLIPKPYAESPPASVAPKAWPLRLWDYLFTDHQTTPITVEQSDPRGGPVMSVDSSLRFNNLHIPYRGGDFVGAHFTPDGRPCSYLQTFPTNNGALYDASLAAAISHLAATASGPGGDNRQTWARGIEMGVSL